MSAAARSGRLGCSMWSKAEAARPCATGFLLRTLVEAEIAAREASNARTRMKNAAFPVTKTLEELDRSASSVPARTLDYLASLEWIAARENLCLVPRRFRTAETVFS